MKTKLKGILTLIMVFMLQLSFAQQGTINGVVTDQSGLPVPGVNVLVKGTQTGTQTDFDGNFTISATPGQVLVFSFIGMTTREVPAAANMKVAMSDDAVQLEGVVVTAFGIKRNPRDLGYAVSTVQSEELTENSEPDLVRSLNGKVAGVNVNVSSGVAGASNQITIRGVTSFTGNNQPLIIVDGIAYSNNEITTSSQVTGGGGYESALSTLDPNNIASVNVLKSTAAAALYGSRAMNGVIVITTKSGSPKSNVSNKLSVNVSSGTYFETIANLPEYQNTYGAGANFNYQNANGSWGPRFDSLETIPTWPNLLAAFPELGPTQPFVAKPNNVKDLFRTGTVLENSVGFSYSGEDGSFSTTISDLSQDGYIPFNSYNRTSVSLGGSFKLKNGLTIGGNMSYSDTEQIGGFFGENQFDGASSSFARTLFLARNWDFNLPYINPTTGYSVIPNAGYDHPLWSWEHDKITTNTTRIVAGTNLSFAFNENISTSYRAGINRYVLGRREIRDLGSRANAGVGALTTDDFTNEDIESTLLVNFDYKLSESFGLQAILGNNVLQTSTSRIAYEGTEFIVPDIFTMKNNKNVANLLDATDRKRNVAFFADVTLSYKDFFFLNATGRNDWTSSLPLDNRSYFYPSVSASLVLTDAFKMESDILTFAKLRGSFAKVGRDAPAEFLNTSFVLGNPYNGSPVIGNPVSLADQDSKPEFANEFEGGIDLEFFKRRIILDFSMYRKEITNLLVEVPVPTSSGFSIFNTNAGDMVNKGIEVGLTLVPFQTENFKWSLFTTFSKNENEVTRLFQGVDRFAIDVNEIAYAIPGQPFGVFYGTKFARDDQGNFLINESGGGIIADPEPGIIGDPQADFKMSFTNTLSYKGLSLKAQVDWKEGGDVSSSTIQSLLGRGVTRDTENRERTVVIPGFYGNNDGTPILDGSGNQIANTTQISVNELYFSPAGGNTFAINSVNEADIYDGTVYRLRELSLTYDLPAKFLDKTPFGRISLSVLGNNLWYFAPNIPKYTNFDPDSTSYGSSNLQGIEVSAAPTSKRYGFRLNLTF